MKVQQEKDISNNKERQPKASVNLIVNFGKTP